MMEDVLKNINMTLKVCTKNNLTRNIGNTIRNKFILGNVDRISIDVYVYPNTLAIEKLGS